MSARPLMTLFRLPSRVPLRWHLALLAVGTLLPVVAFAAMIVLRLANEERAADALHLARSAKSLSAAVDRELSATIRTLSAMAESDRLDHADLAGFHAEAKRVQGTQPTWLAVLLLAPDGQQLVNTGITWGAPLPRAVEPDSLARVVATREPMVGDLAKGPSGKWAFPVRVPVIRGGELRYVLTAVITPHTFVDVVGSGPLPEEWTRTIIDRRGTVVARSRTPERFVGQQGTPSFVRRVRAANEGSFRDTTLEGAFAYVAFSRATSSDWAAAVVVPVEVVDGPIRRSMLVITGVGLMLLFVSGAGAVLVSRRLSRRLAGATAAADALAHGEQPRVEPSSIDEVARLGDALARSADLLARRARERDEHLARAEAARALAETANREKDEFLAMLGHELRNPLSPIVTALAILEMKGHGGTREHGIIGRQVQHVVRLVDDLLEVSRITRGKIELRQEPLELASVVARAVEMVTPLVEQRRHALTLDVPPSGLELDGDPVRLAQVIVNLLTNAARYTKPGGNLHVRARREGDTLVLAVEDDGEGLSAELLPRVFDLFVQAPRAPDRPEGGLGVGLTLVRSLVGLHGGSVEARSEGLGKGSTFIVRLPAAAARATIAAARVATADPTRSAAARSLRVLIVDDNVDAATLLGELLAAHAHEIATAHDGAAALATLDHFAPDVAVLDIGLPILDGYALAAKIREKLGAAAPILVAVTGYGQENDVARSRAAGFHAHFAKPVDPSAFVKAVDELARAHPRAAPRSTAAPAPSTS